MRIPEGQQPESLNVLVFGPTGVGKSTIINLLTNHSAQLRIGNSLESCTEDIEALTIPKKKPADHLTLLADHLSKSYKSAQHKPHIHGVLYVHRITDNRMTGSSITNLRMFRNLIGPHVFKNLVFVTNRWTDPPDPKHIQFEDELLHKDKYFGQAIKAGARGGIDYRILEGSTCSDVQNKLLDLFLEYSPKLLQIQQDLIDENKTIGETAAGQVVSENLSRFMEEIRKEVGSLRQELSELKENDEDKEEIENEKARLMCQLADAEKQEGILQSTLAQIRNNPKMIAGIAAGAAGAVGAVGLLGAGVAGVAEAVSAGMGSAASGMPSSATAVSFVQAMYGEALLDTIHTMGSTGITKIMRFAGFGG